eukprot:6202776-Pleurochrysis_carterae.AAC.1
MYAQSSLSALKILKREGGSGGDIMAPSDWSIAEIRVFSLKPVKIVVVMCSFPESETVCCTTDTERSGLWLRGDRTSARTSPGRHTIDPTPHVRDDWPCINDHCASLAQRTT